MRLSRLLLLGFLFCLGVFAHSFNSVLAAPNYSAIVLVRAYQREDNGFFSADKTGSAGVLVSADGLILAGNGLLVAGSSYSDQAFKVCVINSEGARDCSLTAYLVAESKENKMVLLKLLNPPQSLPFAEVSGIEQVGATNLNLSFLKKGEGGSFEIVHNSTKLKNLFGDSWAIFDSLQDCLGSSRFILADNKLVAIAHHEQGKSCLSGYALDTAKIIGWFNNSKKSSLSQPAAVDFDKLLKLNRSVNVSSSFQNAGFGLPNFSISKNVGWSFDVSDLNNEKEVFSVTQPPVLSIRRSGTSASLVGGTISIIPYLRFSDGSLSDIDGFFERFVYPMSGGALAAKVEAKRDFNQAGLKGREYEVLIAGAPMKFRVFSSGNYFIVLSFNYGVDNEDRVEVEQILSSFKLEKKPFESLKNYSDSKNKFSIQSSSDWLISGDGNGLIGVGSKKFPGFEVRLSYYPLPKAGFNNNDFILAGGDLSSARLERKNFLNKFKEGLLGWSENIYSFQEHFSLGTKIRNAVLIKTEAIRNKKDEKAIRSFALGYKVKNSLSDGFMVFEGDFYGKQKDFDTAFNSFTSFLASSLQVDNLHSEAINGKVNEILVGVVSYNISDIKLYQRLKGRILIKTQDDGEAYYVDPVKPIMYFLGRPADAFKIMRNQGIGVKTESLSQIGLMYNRASGPDSDNDGLADTLEDALGTDKNSADTDGDAYSDKDEIVNGYSPLVKNAKINIDYSFSAKQKGKILLQVEGKGEAWYVNPVNAKRYFLGRPVDAFAVMRTLGLGISNDNFNKMIK